jgi:predicted glycosyltransferase
MVVNQGKDRGGELRRFLGLKKPERLVYLYVGRYGQSDLDWPALAGAGRHGVHFVTYPPLPARAPSNLHAVPSQDWPGSDLIATCEAVFAKAGYGTVCEAMASGTPLIYPPRHGFAEHRSLDRSLRAWGGGVPISSREFRSLRLKRALQKALTIKPAAPPFPTDGAVRIARYLTAICRRPNTRPPWADERQN